MEIKIVTSIILKTFKQIKKAIKYLFKMWKIGHFRFSDKITTKKGILAKTKRANVTSKIRSISGRQKSGGGGGGWKRRLRSCVLNLYGPRHLANSLERRHRPNIRAISTSLESYPYRFYEQAILIPNCIYFKK